MNSFKDIAYQILLDAGKPLHSKEITKIALDRGWLKTAGKTPEATMNAQLLVDINKKKDTSRFVKTAPSTYGLNEAVKTLEISASDQVLVSDEVEAEQKYKISDGVSSKQKGDIAEARIAELITLYGDTALSCYKPVSDDEGIDIIVKRRKSLKTMYIQVKSVWRPDKTFVVTVKTKTLIDNYAMGLVFCLFDTEEGDLWDYLWFVPAPEFMKLANRLDGGERLGFVAGKKRNESNKWDQFLIDKRDLANSILKQMNRI